LGLCKEGNTVPVIFISGAGPNFTACLKTALLFRVSSGPVVRACAGPLRGRTLPHAPAPPVFLGNRIPRTGRGQFLRSTRASEAAHGHSPERAPFNSVRFVQGKGRADKFAGAGGPCVGPGHPSRLYIDAGPWLGPAPGPGRHQRSVDRRHPLLFYRRDLEPSRHFGGGPTR